MHNRRSESDRAIDPTRMRGRGKAPSTSSSSATNCTALIFTAVIMILLDFAVQLLFFRNCTRCSTNDGLKLFQDKYIYHFSKKMSLKHFSYQGHSISLTDHMG